MASEKTVKTVGDIIATYVKRLPCLQELLTDFNVFRSRIYGGFPRFIADFYLSNHSPPTMIDVLEYLVKGDIDIKIKSFKMWQVLAKFLMNVQSIGGSIEYIGIDSRRISITLFCKKQTGV